MSRELPERPNLDHLRKQAKVLLRDLRRRDPDATLAAAQHAVAREYGFGSWRVLKAHVQTQAAQDSEAPPLAFAFARYTARARMALFFSRDEAGQLGSPSIKPEHLLLGSIRAAVGLNGRIFERVNVSLERVRAAIMATVRVAKPIPHSVEIPFSGPAKRVLLAATGEADRLGHNGIGIAHLLLGMLGQPESVASVLLTGWGMNVQNLMRDIVQLLNEEPA